MATNTGTGGNDTINGTPDVDQYSGGGGDDTITGAGGNDNLFGGAGKDTISGGEGGDSIYGDGFMLIRTLVDADNMLKVGDYPELASLSGTYGSPTDYGTAGATLVNYRFTQSLMPNQSVWYVNGDGSLVYLRSITSQNPQNITAPVGAKFVFANPDGHIVGGTLQSPVSTAIGDPGITNDIGSYSDPEFYQVFPGGDADILSGGDGNDIIYGQTGDDEISGDAGDDVVYGNIGNDKIEGGVGSDTISGGVGDDVIYGNAEGADADTTDGSDNITGGDGNDTIYGQAGDDNIGGGNDNDTIYGGLGNDAIIGEAGADIIDGGDGNDVIAGDGGPYLPRRGGTTQYVDDVLSSDALQGATYEFTTQAELLQSGNDFWLLQATSEWDAFVTTYVIVPGQEPTLASLATDTMGLPAGGTRVWAIPEGASVMVVRAGIGAGTGLPIGYIPADYIAAQTPVDITYKNQPAQAYPVTYNTDTLKASDLDPFLTTGGADTITAGAGNDIVYGGIDDDNIDGGDGNDLILGEEGNDTITAGAGADIVYGDIQDADLSSGSTTDPRDTVDWSTVAASSDVSEGTWDVSTPPNTVEGDAATFDDTIDGGTGADVLFGGTGNDKFTIGAGDYAFGGADQDTFVISAADAADADLIRVHGGTTTTSGDEADDFDTLNWDELIALYGRPDFERVRDVDGNSWSGNATFTRPDGTTLVIEYKEMEVVPCFTRGTLIEGENGLVAVEDIKAGDMIMTKDHGLKPVLWASSRSVNKDDLDLYEMPYPVRITAGALGNGLPERDMIVSPQHRMLVSSNAAHRIVGSREVLVAAKELVVIEGIDFVTDFDEVEYFHFMFDQHEVVIAEGAETESLYAGREIMKSLPREVRDEILALFPEIEEFSAQDMRARPARDLPQGDLARKLVNAHARHERPLVS